MNNTETLDKLFLEISQTTRARTKKEIDLAVLLHSAYDALFVDQLAMDELEDLMEKIEIALGL